MTVIAQDDHFWPPVVWKINFNQTGRRDKATSHRSTTMINNNDQQQ